MKLYTTLLAFVFSPSLFAQNVQLDWAFQVGAGAKDVSQAMTRDLSGNLIITGYFEGTVDFDPGTGTKNMVSNLGTMDCFVQKVDANGNLIWANQVGNSSSESGRAVCTDAQNNIYVLGQFRNTVDFDPGPGTFNLTAYTNSSDIFVQKLDSNGAFIWAAKIGGTDSKDGYSICTDDSGNVYTSGNFSGKVDFDPSGVSYELTSAGFSDAFVQKLDASGNLVWAHHFGSAGIEAARSVAFDPSGFLYVSGSYTNTVDFDPGAGTSNLSSSGHMDIFILKLTRSGALVWVRGIGGGGPDESTDLKMDALGNLVHTGYFSSATDFDPGLGVEMLNNFGSMDIFVQKLSGNGQFIWAKNMGGTGADRGYKLHLDAHGNAFLTGQFSGTADFDPLIAEAKITSKKEFDIFVQKIDSSGAFHWVKGIGGFRIDFSTGVVSDNNGNAYVTGQFTGTIDVDPGLATHNLTPSYPAAYQEDYFVVKLKPCSPITSTHVVLACKSFTWIDSITYTASNSTAMYTLPSATGCDSVVSLNLTINNVSNTNTTLNKYTITAVNANGSYRWLNCDSNFAPVANANAQSFTATKNGNYAVEITENGCTDTSECVNITGIGVGLSADFSQARILLYPNPSFGNYTLHVFENYTKLKLKVIDLQGRIILLEDHSNTAKIDFSLNAAAGMYWLVLETEAGKQVIQLEKY